MKLNLFQSISKGRCTLLVIILLGISVISSQILTGCAVVGRDFPAAEVSNIQIGKTSQDEIRNMFGSPWRVGIEDGQRTWTYGKYRYVLFSEKSAKDLVIRFDAQSLVASYTFSTTEHEE